MYVKTFTSSTNFVSGAAYTSDGLSTGTDVVTNCNISSLTDNSYVGVQLGSGTNIGTLKFLFLE